MHRGQAIGEGREDEDRSIEVPALGNCVGSRSESPTPVRTGSAIARFVAAAIADLRIVVKGGFIPHAKHGGNGVEAVAVVGSKLEGTGLEKEHIEQTQVAFTGLGGDTTPEAKGLLLCTPGDVCAGDRLINPVNGAGPIL